MFAQRMSVQEEKEFRIAELAGGDVRIWSFSTLPSLMLRSRDGISEDIVPKKRSAVL